MITGYRRGPLVVFALSALLLAGLQAAEIALVHGGDWTGPFLVGQASGGERGEWPIPVRVDPSSPGYDGQFFLALAFDPFLRTPVSRLLDDREYRAHRIVWPLAAWILGGGDDEARVLALYLLNLLGIALGGALVALVAVAHGRSRWWGVAFVLGLGPMVCVWRMLGDALMVTLLLGVAALVSRERPRLAPAAAALFALAVLEKETALLALPLLVIPRRRWRSRSGVAALGLAGATVAGWWLYVHAVVSEPRVFSLAIPFDGPGRGWASCVGAVFRSWPGAPRAGTQLVLLLVYGAAIVLGLWIGWTEARRVRTQEPPRGLPLAIGLFALLGVFLSARVWVEPWAYARVLLPLLALEGVWGVESRPGAKRPGAQAAARALLLASAACGVVFTLRNLWMGTP